MANSKYSKRFILARVDYVLSLHTCMLNNEALPPSKSKVKAGSEATHIPRVVDSKDIVGMILSVLSGFAGSLLCPTIDRP